MSQVIPSSKWKWAQLKQFDTCQVVWKNIWGPFSGFDLFPLLPLPIPKRIKTRDRIKPVGPRFEQVTQIEFYCSNMWRFVSNVSACSFTKVTIVPEGYFSSFPSWGSSAANRESDFFDSYIFILLLQQMWLCCSNEVVCKPLWKLRWKGRNKLIACYSKPEIHLPVFTFLVYLTF